MDIELNQIIKGIVQKRDYSMRIEQQKKLSNLNILLTSKWVDPYLHSYPVQIYSNL